MFLFVCTYKWTKLQRFYNQAQKQKTNYTQRQQMLVRQCRQTLLIDYGQRQLQTFPLQCSRKPQSASQGCQGGKNNFHEYIDEDRAWHFAIQKSLIVSVSRAQRIHTFHKWSWGKWGNEENRGQDHPTAVLPFLKILLDLWNQGKHTTIRSNQF